MSEEQPKFIGSYRIESKLGQGGMGAVYRAAHETLDRPAAIKILPPDMASPEYVSRFLREARTVATLNHPHIVQVYDAGSFEGKYFIAMELIEGQSLQDYCEEQERLDEQEALRLLHQAALGLSVAHAKGLVHRDIKPENLLLDKERNLHIVDFGLVRETASQTQLTVTGVCLGTPMYMSPEQADGERSDARSDIYSLGVTFYRAVAGQPPFFSPTVMSLLFKHKFDAPDDPRKHGAKLSEKVVQLLFTMMAKSPKDRPQNGQALVDLVEKLMRGESIPAAPAFKKALPDTGMRAVEDHEDVHAGGIVLTGRRPLIMAGVAALLVLVVASVALFALIAGRKPDTGNGTGSAKGGAAGTTKTGRGSEAERQELTAGARKFEASGELELALAMYQRALARGGTDPELEAKVEKLKGKLDEYGMYVRDGEKAFALGEYTAARANFSRALRLRPRSEEALSKLKAVNGQLALHAAEKARAAGNTTLAKQEYRKALTYCPELEQEIQRQLAALERPAISSSEVMATVNRLVREGKDAEAHARLNDALRMNPTDAMLVDTKSSLDVFLSYNSLHDALRPILLKGRDAAQNARSIGDDDDGAAKDLRRSLESMLQQCDTRKAEARTQFLARYRPRLNQILAEGKGAASGAGRAFQSAADRYMRKATEVGKERTYGVGPFKVRKKGDSVKAQKYRDASQTFDSLARQAEALGR